MAGKMTVKPRQATFYWQLFKLALLEKRMKTRLQSFCIIIKNEAENLQ
jgi:hypothetical protein